MLFTIVTPVPVTPLTAVVSVLPVVLLPTADTAFEVAEIPLTVEVSVLVDRDRLLVVPVVINSGLTQLALPLPSVCRI